MKSTQKFWHQWILHYSFGELIGIGAAATIGRVFIFGFSSLTVEETSLIDYGILLAAGLTEGIIIGFFQGRSIASIVPNFNLRRWITFTTVASIAGWLLILPPAIMFVAFLSSLSLLHKYYTTLSTLIAGAAFGGIVGMTQFFIIRKHFINSVLWILCNTIGWGLSFLIILEAWSMFSVRSNLVINFALIVGACLASGAAQGIVTGTLLHYGMPMRISSRISIGKH